MEKKLAKADTQVLVDIVKLVQKRGMEGTVGGWKDFLNIYDKLRGSCVGSDFSDPAKRDTKALVAFLNTFTNEGDLQFVDRMLQFHLNRGAVEQLKKEPQENEPLEQGLVRLTVQHPFYPLEYTFPSHEEGWVYTKYSQKSKVNKSKAMVAVDCEMVLCEDGTEALVKICVVDRDLQEKVNHVVKPDKAVADFRTDVTGVSQSDLVGVTCSLADIQKTMMKLLSDGKILVGHSLSNDMKAMKLDHARVIDTSYIFKYSDAPIYKRPALNSLCKSVLGYEVRKDGAPHNCLDDARAAMNLVLSVLDRRVDLSIPLVRDVPDSEMSKLLIHKIPVEIPSQLLDNLVPGNVRIEIQTSKKPRKEHYSACAIFRSPEEADQAFQKLNGDEGKDSNGLPQKLVDFQFSKGCFAKIFVRKMVSHGICKPSEKKRSPQAEEEFLKPKKLKTDQEDMDKTSGVSELPVDNLKEIKRLRRKVQEKDALISVKDKTISDLQRKLEKTKRRNLKEIERLRREVQKKDALISVKDKTISDLQRKLEKTKKRNLKEIERLRREVQEDALISVKDKTISDLQRKLEKTKKRVSKLIKGLQ